MKMTIPYNLTGKQRKQLAEDIIVALRVDQSQDAEELKQLGAVAHDYRPLTHEEAQRLLDDPPSTS